MFPQQNNSSLLIIQTFNFLTVNKGRPVLLGGIYKQTSAPQGKDGSASDVMPASKKKMHAIDLHRMIVRHNIPFRFSSYHINKTFLIQRLMSMVKENEKVQKLAEAFYKAYWVSNEDINDVKIIERIIKECGVSLTIDFVEKAPENLKAILTNNTQEAVNRGAFGVPCYYIEPDKKFFFGADRLNFVEQCLSDGQIKEQLRLFRMKPIKRQKLTFYYDFSSPWAYIASTQVERVAKSCNADLEMVPILLGALFKEVGTPNVPMFAISETKRAYMSKDMLEWVQWWNIDFKFTTNFPLRSVLPLRVNIIEPKTFHLFYEAAWVKNINIGDPVLVVKLLNEAGFNGEELVKKAENNEIKEKLRINTVRAKEEGLFGVPSFQINDKEVVWGQDKLNLVEDMLCGWRPDDMKPKL